MHRVKKHIDDLKLKSEEALSDLKKIEKDLIVNMAILDEIIRILDHEQLTGLVLIQEEKKPDA